MKVADKVMNESSFSYYSYSDRIAEFPHTIDFGEKSANPNAVFYAFSHLVSEKEREAIIGISSGVPVKIWINDNLVYSKPDAGNTLFKEIAYGIYEFSDTFKIKLNNKINKIMIKVVNKKQPKVILGIIQKDGSIDRTITFSLNPLFNKEINDNWLITGPFEASEGDVALIQGFPPESGFSFYYSYNGDIFTWKIPEKHLLLNRQIPQNASFRTHPYTEWHYSNGATLWSILRLAEATGEEKYREFVKKYCKQTINDYSLFKRQYYVLNEYKGFNYRIWRMHMLDDSSAPALPFIELYGKGDLDSAWFLIEKAAKFASQDQFRLEDKTLCRPEPTRWTIWADDLFMYLPFILKYAKITSDKALQEDAVYQAKMFHKYLFDKEKGLYYHGWYSHTNSHSAAAWSRANGWVAWAMSELLINFPENNAEYEKILKIQREHLEGLLKYQHESGLFHQVLDRPDTYLETSGTAMFVIAMARGINNGWLGEKYKTAVKKAWAGILSKIESDGTIRGICRGTAIGKNVDFYQKRDTRLHDPRGVGAVVTAGIEMQKIIR